MTARLLFAGLCLALLALCQTARAASLPAVQTDSNFLVPLTMPETAAYGDRPGSTLDSETGDLYVSFAKPSNGRVFVAVCEFFAGTCDTAIDVSALAGEGDSTGTEPDAVFFEGSLYIAANDATGGNNRAVLYVCTASISACDQYSVSDEDASGNRPSIGLDPINRLLLIGTTSTAPVAGAPTLFVCPLDAISDCNYVDIARASGLQSSANVGNLVSLDVFLEQVYYVSVDLAPPSGGNRILLFVCATDGTACKRADVTAAVALNSASQYNPRVRIVRKDDAPYPILIAAQAVTTNNMLLIRCTVLFKCQLLDVTAATAAPANSGAFPTLAIDSSAGNVYLAGHSQVSTVRDLNVFTCGVLGTTVSCTASLWTNLGGDTTASKARLQFDTDAWSIVATVMSVDGVRIRRRSSSCTQAGAQLSSTTTCEVCPTGTALNTTIPVPTCVPCKPGTFAPVVGLLDNCQACAANLFCPAGSTKQLPVTKMTSGADVPVIYRREASSFQDTKLVGRVFIILYIVLGAFAVVFGLALALFLWLSPPPLRETAKNGLRNADMFPRENGPPAILKKLLGKVPGAAAVSNLKNKADKLKDKADKAKAKADAAAERASNVGGKAGGKAGGAAGGAGAGAAASGNVNTPNSLAAAAAQKRAMVAEAKAEAKRKAMEKKAEYRAVAQARIDEAKAEAKAKADAAKADATAKVNEGKDAAGARIKAEKDTATAAAAGVGTGARAGGSSSASTERSGAASGEEGAGGPSPPPGPLPRLRTAFGGYVGVVAIVGVVLAIVALSVQLVYANAIVVVAQNIGENALNVPLASRPTPRLRVTLSLDGVSIEAGSCFSPPPPGVTNHTACAAGFVASSGFPSTATFATPTCVAIDSACVATWECTKGCALFSAPAVTFSYPGAGFATVISVVVDATAEDTDFRTKSRSASVAFQARPSGTGTVLQRKETGASNPFVFSVSIFQRILIDRRSGKSPKPTLGWALVEPQLKQLGPEVAASKAVLSPPLIPGPPAVQVAFTSQAFHEVTTVTTKDSEVSFMSFLGGAISGVMGVGLVVVQAAEFAQSYAAQGLAAFALWRMTRRVKKEAGNSDEEALLLDDVSSSDSEGDSDSEAAASGSDSESDAGSASVSSAASGSVSASASAASDS